MLVRSIDLLRKALEKQSASAWSRSYNTTPSVFTDAKARGRLSPILAGNLAIDLGEDASKWIAIAALEAERESPMRDRLNEKLNRRNP